jgi:hypothetical protein
MLKKKGWLKTAPAVPAKNDAAGDP